MHLLWKAASFPCEDVRPAANLRKVREQKLRILRRVGPDPRGHWRPDDPGLPKVELAMEMKGPREQHSSRRSVVTFWKKVEGGEWSFESRELNRAEIRDFWRIGEGKIGSETQIASWSVWTELTKQQLHYLERGGSPLYLLPPRSWYQRILDWFYGHRPDGTLLEHIPLDRVK